MPEIKGLVYRVKTYTGTGWLIEVSEENALREIQLFCAKKFLAGNHITSVTRIFPDAKDTPRMAFKDKEFNAIVNNLLKRQAAGERISTDDDTLEAKLKQLIADNEENLKVKGDTFDTAYAQGLHDGLVDAMNAAGIQHSETYYN